VKHGTPPSKSPLLETAGGQLVRDANGIALGGIRTPAVDAPVATLSGLGQTGGSQFCFLFGSTVPFSNAQLEARYHNHRGFAFAWALATLKATCAGFVRPADTFKLILAGARSDLLK
jgi:hypothetical protein